MGTTSIPGVFLGVSCPRDISFGFIHGTSPVSAKATLLGGNFLPPIGSIQTFQVGGSPFTGYVVGREYDPIADETVIHLVDWRDKLHDVHVACAFNCEEDDGRFFHILPYNWQIQRRTYVTRELGQFDFDQFQRLDPAFSFEIQVAKNVLYSALTILDWMGSVLGFKITGDTLALYKLSLTYPLNLDWNNGSTKVIDAMQQIMNKCGTQMTFFGYNQVYVTIRGYTENIFSAALEFIGDITTFCLLGISSGKIGEELNELGRRVVIVGDRNKHEFVYPLRANWNPAWSYDMAAGGIELVALLNENKLTMRDKVSDLPEEYHDNETWNDADNAGKGALPARKTRNMMTIQDYTDKIVFKAYVVDAGYYVPDFTVATFDKPQGTIGFLDQESLEPFDESLTFDISEFTRDTDFDNAGGNFHYPISRTLVTDSNIQSIVYSATWEIEQSAENILSNQAYLVPRSRGVSFDMEEVVNPKTGEVEYRVRVFFDEIQINYQGPKDEKILRPEYFMTDTVLIRLAVDADIYNFVAGEGGLETRVREQLINIRNLYRSFVNAKEVTVLRENVKAYWEKLIGAQPLSYVPVRADDIAKSVALQALTHYATTLSGSVHYDDICGTFPDGIIDSVQVGWSGEPGQGIVEDVNFTTGFADDREYRHPFPVRISRRFKDEEELINDRLREMSRQTAKDRQQQGKVMGQPDGDMNKQSSLRNLSQAAVAYAKDGLMEVDFTLGWLNENQLDTGELIAMNPPFTDENLQSPPT